MCTRPILISNRKFRPLSFIPHPNRFVKVPCGQCDECLRKRAKDLYVRARYEAERVFLRGGCGFMCALTYDNDTLPYLEFEGKKYMVFNKKHVIDFLKRLRVSLDRVYLKHYGVTCPDFKYLITSEYGTDPTRTHRPHYHLIVLFDRFISLNTFKMCFQKCLVNNKTKKRVFGRIFQCDPLDIKRGGIRYSAKYVLKDQTFEHQRIIINNHIKFFTHYVNSKYGIIEFPKSENDFFFNKCVRSSKEYKKDIRTFVSPYRHMLQFYMLSNDFGGSAIIERYGENLYTLGVLSLDGLPYSIPKQVTQRLERNEGSIRKDNLTKAVFISQLESNLQNYPLFGEEDKAKLLYFAKNFIQPRFASLYFISPDGVSYYNKIAENPLQDYDLLFEEFGFYDDNNFFELREQILKVQKYFESPDKLEFRAKLARERTCKEREDYVKKKRNKPFNFS